MYYIYISTYWHKCICKYIYIYTMTPILERQNAIFLYQVQNTSGASDATFASWAPGEDDGLVGGHKLPVLTSSDCFKVA